MICSFLAIQQSLSIAASPAPISKIQVGLLIGGVSVLILLTLRQRSKLRTKHEDSTRSKEDSSAQSVRELEAAMLQLDQLSRQIHAKIDLKLATLQKLIRDADQRIDQLAGIHRDPASEPKLDIRLGSESPEDSQADEANPHEAIYRLADSGYTPMQIARELARHTGEVELILSLRRARSATLLAAPSLRKQAG